MIIMANFLFRYTSHIYNTTLHLLTWLKKLWPNFDLDIQSNVVGIACGDLLVVDERRFHSYKPEIKRQSKQWASPSEPALKKTETLSNGRKGDFLEFTTCDLYRLDLEKDKRLHASTVPNCWPDSTLSRRKNGRTVTQLNWSNYDGATNSCPIHRIIQIRATLFFYYQTWKSHSLARNFESNEEVIAATKSYFTDLHKTYFPNGLK